MKKRELNGIKESVSFTKDNIKKRILVDDKNTENL